MEINEIKVTKTNFKKYIRIINELEHLFDKYGQKNGSQICLKEFGFLIHKKYYDNIKDKLNYSIFKSYIADDNEFNSKLDEFYENKKEISFIPCKQELFYSSKDLIQNLFKNNEYAIINFSLWKIINNGKYIENEGRIKYEIRENKIILSFGTGINVYFKYNSNIISYKNLVSSSKEKNNEIKSPMKLIINQNFNNKITKEKMIDKLYLSMIEFNNFEKLIMNKLKLDKNDTNEIMEGYFLEKNWFLKWKEFTDYDNSKILLSENNIEKKINQIKSKVKSISQSELYPISIIKYFNNYNLENILKNETIILVNERFLSIFENNLEYQGKYKIKFIIDKHQIIFLFEKGNNKSIYSLNNILPIEKNKSYQIANNLIELYIFQEQLKIRIKKEKNNENDYLILVDTKYLTYIKNKYSYNKIIDSIKDKGIIKYYINQLNKSDRNGNYILDDIIEGFNWDCFYDIYNDDIKDIIENYEIDIKEIYSDNNKKSINYLDNFELIDINIFNKLYVKEKIKNKISKKIEQYYIRDNKILINYENQEKRDIYLIGNIQDNNIFIQEYYIEPIDTIGFKTFLTKIKLSELFKRNDGNIISNNNKTIGKLFKLNTKIKCKEINTEAVYDLYLFNEELKKQLNDNSNKVTGGKLYLIKERWFAEFKTIYLYEDIYHSILSKKNNFSFYSRNIIIKAINDNYLNNIIKCHKKNKHKFPFLLEDNDYLKFNYDIDINEQEVYISEKYSFINENILEKIISSELNINEINICDYYINNKKFIIKYKNNYIIIGEIKFINNSNLFFPKIILDYNRKHKMNEHYSLLKTFTNDIKSLFNLKGDKVENIIEKDSNKIIGRAYFITNYNSPDEFDSKEIKKEIIINNINNDLNNKILLEENEKLKEELNFYKKENKNLIKEINKLKDNNIKLNNELINANKIISNLSKIQQNNLENIKMINNLNELIQIKDKELNDLKLKLISSGNKDNLINNDDLMFVHFVSCDEKINCVVKCLETNTFAEVEEKLYEKYEEYRETNNNFRLKGKLILRFKKIFENNIKDGDIIRMDLIK